MKFIDLRDDFTLFDPPDGCHTVDIFDEDAKALAHLFLPPAGTQISGEDLEACVRRLTDAANAIKRARREKVRVQ